MPPHHQFAALADPTRCRVVELLHGRPRPVHELAGAFAISRPALSRHLRILKDAGVVSETRRGRENVYSLKQRTLQQMGEWLAQYWSGRLEALKAAAEGRTA